MAKGYTSNAITGREMAKRGSEGHKAKLGREDCRVFRESKERQALLDRKGRKESKERQALLDRKGRKESEAIRALPDHKGRKESKERQAIPDRRDRRVFPARTEW